MSPPDPSRPRAPTLPPTPPSGPSGYEMRLWALEHGQGTLERGMEALTAEVRKQTEVMTTIQNTMLVASTEKSASDKRRENFMKWVVGVAIGVSVMALGTLAAWVIHLQTALAAAHG